MRSVVISQILLVTCACLCGPSSIAVAQPVEVLPSGREVAPKQAASPAPPISPRSKVETSDRFAFRAGFAITAISGGVQLAALSVYPFAVAGNMFEEGGIGILAGMFVGLFGLMAVGAGIAETVVAAIMLPRYRKNHLDEPLPDRAWNAGLMKGLGVGYLLHGAVNLAIAIPITAASDENLGANKGTLRVAGWVGLAVGGVQVLVGAILGLTGHVKAGRVMREVSVAPLIDSDRAVVLVGLRF